VLRKQLVAFVVSAALLLSPAMADDSIVGVTTEGQGFTLQGLKALPGTSVFSGDIVKVGKAGWARFTLNDRTLLSLSEEGMARFLKGKEGLQLEVGKGKIAFHIPAKSNFTALLADATIRRSGTAPVAGLVVFRSTNLAVVAAEKGSLTITSAHDGKSLTLKEGEGVEVALAPAPSSAAAPPPPVAALTGVQIAIIGVVVAAVSIAAGAALSSAEPNLSQQQVQATVSPIRP